MLSATSLRDYTLCSVELLPKKFDKESFISLQPFLYLFGCSFLFPFLSPWGSDHTSYRKAGIFTDLSGHIRPNQKSCGRHKAVAFQSFHHTHSCVALMSECENHAILPSSVNCRWSLITVGAGVHPSLQQIGCRNTPWMGHLQQDTHHSHTLTKVSSLSHVHDLWRDY